MAFDIVRKNKANGDVTHILVATVRSFKDEWLPLGTQLGLRFVPLLGQAGRLSEEDRQGLIAELETLRRHIRSQTHDEQEWIADRIDGILIGLIDHSCDEYQFVLG